jgi:hypothetical protein
MVETSFEKKATVLFNVVLQLFLLNLFFHTDSTEASSLNHPLIVFIFLSVPIRWGLFSSLC